MPNISKNRRAARQNGRKGGYSRHTHNAAAAQAEADQVADRQATEDKSHDAQPEGAGASTANDLADQLDSLHVDDDDAAEAAPRRTRAQKAAAMGAHLHVNGAPAPTKDQAALPKKVLAAVDGAQDSMAGLVLEPFHGSLSDVLQQQKCGWLPRLGVLKCVAAGMARLHAKNVTHWNLRSDNIFVWEGSYGEVRAVVGPPAPSDSMAPEVLRCLSPAVDIYSFGNVMGEVVSPGRAAEDKRPPASSNPPDGCSMEVYGRYTTLMHKCWRNEPSVRPSFDEVHRELTALCTLTQHENKAAEERQG